MGFSVSSMSIPSTLGRVNRIVARRVRQIPPVETSSLTQLYRSGEPDVSSVPETPCDKLDKAFPYLRKRPIPDPLPYFHQHPARSSHAHSCLENKRFDPMCP